MTFANAVMLRKSCAGVNSQEDQFSAVATMHMKMMVIAEVVKLTWIWINLKIKLKIKRISCVSRIHKQRPESAYKV